jgi:hypothetical protein
MDFFAVLTTNDRFFAILTAIDGFFVHLVPNIIDYLNCGFNLNWWIFCKGSGKVPPAGLGKGMSAPGRAREGNG